MIGLFAKSFKQRYKRTQPNPYKGQSGPIKNPLFTNLFSTTSPYRTSRHQPTNEKIIKQINNLDKYDMAILYAKMRKFLK